MSLDIDIQVASTGDRVPDPSQIRRWVTATLAAGAAVRPHAPTELSVRIVGADESRRLNRQYRGRDKPTNVLSFPADLPPDLPLPLLGDLVVCAPVVIAEARDQGKPVEAHWAHMLVHGTLHLLGYDHVADADALVMEDLETRILLDLHYPAPYELDRQAAGH
ncbi:rRNA maturation RNase YbeY [Exilibacterium tricleocarpae]|uniref:Endoribonuclease YbeY n=1 Tax=Exilibacterium tricleocarpae TaxID=2591008 RepID=A0A545STF3_9GAMM|nr:rRNA maturation RNase YbeY [Exilibacterium tricleocarpae]TQV68232.1 rRNA maturation RNase YbeY [Exilibacterium tricleocarpae]